MQSILHSSSTTCTSQARWLVQLNGWESTDLQLSIWHFHWLTLPRQSFCQLHALQRRGHRHHHLQVLCRREAHKLHEPADRTVGGRHNHRPLLQAAHRSTTGDISHRRNETSWARSHGDQHRTIVHSRWASTETRLAANTIAPTSLRHIDAAILIAVFDAFCGKMEDGWSGWMGFDIRWQVRLFFVGFTWWFGGRTHVVY